MNITLKVFSFSKLFCLFQYSPAASAPHLSSLMISYGAEAASAKTASRADYAELDLLKGRYLSLFFIFGMRLIFKRQRIDVIQFFSCQWRAGSILHHPNRIGVFLSQSLCSNIVIIGILHSKAPGISFLIIINLLKIRQFYPVFFRSFAAFPTSTAYPGNILDIYSCIESVSNFHDCLLSHSVYEKIRFGI